jgi:chorismate dehydratase
VRTVKLWSRVPLDSLQNVAVDGRSRTSVALLRILLSERYGVTPDFYSVKAKLPEMLKAHEAALLIGDDAFTDLGAPHVWDLGQAWKDLTGLPFVYAVWTLGAGVDRDRVAGWLQASLDLGLEHLPEIAHEAAGTQGQDEATLLCYLRDNLHFALGERDLQGIEAFQRCCQRYNLIPAIHGMRVGVTVQP